jgi:hypothetical protein
MRKLIKLYNEKECWEKYMSWGAAASTQRLLNWHRAEHGFGTRMGPVFAMWRWAVNNPEECYPQYKEFHRHNAPGEDLSQYSNFKIKWFFENYKSGEYQEITFEEFLNLIKKLARVYVGSVLGKKAYKRFCDKYGLKE